MKLAAVCAGALLCASASPPDDGHNTRSSDVFPPPRFHAAEIGLPVLLVNNVEPFCGTAPKGKYVIACVRRLSNGQPVMVLPNPCFPVFRGEFFARIACHEKAHSVGWSGMHEE